MTFPTKQHFTFTRNHILTNSLRSFFVIICLLIELRDNSILKKTPFVGGLGFILGKITGLLTSISWFSEINWTTTFYLMTILLGLHFYVKEHDNDKETFDWGFALMALCVCGSLLIRLQGRVSVGHGFDAIKIVTIPISFGYLIAHWQTE